MTLERARTLTERRGAGHSLRTPRAPSLGLHYGYVVLACCVAVVAAAIGLGRWGYTLILPGMKAGLGLAYAQSGLLASGELVGFTAAALFVASVCRQIGLRRAIALFLSLSTGAAILAGLSQEFYSALVARAVAGVGAAGGYIVALSLASAWFARRYRGLATGCMMSGTWLGMAIGGNVLPQAMAANDTQGWRYAWFVVAVALFLTTVVTAVLLRASPSEKGIRPLWVDNDQPLAEGSSLSPTADMAVPIWRIRPLWHFAAWYAAYGLSYVIYASFFAGHLLNNGLSGAEAGRLWALTGLVGLPSAPAWGLLSDRFGRRRTVVLAFLAQACSYAVFAGGSGPLAYGFSILLFGSTAAAVATVIAASVGDHVPPPAVPKALGLLTVVFGVSQAVAPWLGGAIADRAGSFGPSLCLASLIALAGALVAGACSTTPHSEEPVERPANASTAA